jgi:hypothetical protein
MRARAVRCYCSAGCGPLALAPRAAPALFCACLDMRSKYPAWSPMVMVGEQVGVHE